MLLCWRDREGGVEGSDWDIGPARLGCARHDHLRELALTIERTS